MTKSVMWSRGRRGRRQAGGGAVVDPIATDPDLIAYWDSSDTASIVATADAVTSFADQSANGYDLEDNDPSTRPITGGTRNGNNIITFSEDVLYSPRANGLWSELGTNLTVICCANATNNNGNFISFFGNPGRPMALGPSPFVTGRYQIYINNTSFTPISGTDAPTGPQIAVLRITLGGASSLSINGSTKTGSFTAPSTYGFSVDGADFSLMALSRFAQEPTDGDHCATALIGRHMTDAEVNVRCNFLATKWDISDWSDL